MDTCIVLTTIRVPELLLDYADNFIKYGHYNVGFIVVGDIPTPHEETKSLIQNVKNKGFEAQYFDIKSQRRWLRKYPELAKIIPYRSDNRRNIGFLIAAEEGAHTIISIDDDNYVTEEDYYKYHNIVGKMTELSTVSSSNGWYNPCTLLETDHGGIIYPRGYPFSRRFRGKYTFKEGKGHVVLNMGLWINDPDVDAITHLAYPTRIMGMKKNHEYVMLAPKTYSPINTQNTAFHPKILPCYYYVLMNAYLKGLRIDRYGDIWSGFFAKKVIDKMNERVTMGKPLTNHKRNVHNFLNDLKHELWGMILTEEIIMWLEQLQLDNNDYSGAYLEIAEGLYEFTEKFQDPTIRRYLKKLSSSMKVWIETCKKIL